MQCNKDDLHTGDLVRVMTFTNFEGREIVVCDVMGIYISHEPWRVTVLTSTSELYAAYFVEADGDVIDVIQPAVG